LDNLDLMEKLVPRVRLAMLEPMEQMAKMDRKVLLVHKEKLGM